MTIVAICIYIFKTQIPGGAWSRQNRAGGAVCSGNQYLNVINKLDKLIKCMIFTKEYPNWQTKGVDEGVAQADLHQ